MLDLGKTYEEYKELVRRICSEYESDPDKVEDLCQDVWLRVIESYDGSMNIKAWVITLARNVCKNHIRYEMYRRGNTSLDEVNLEGEEFLDEETPEALYEAAEAVWERVKET